MRQSLAEMKRAMIGVGAGIFLFGWAISWIYLYERSTVHSYEWVAIAIALPLGLILWGYGASLPFTSLPPKNRIYYIEAVGKTEKGNYLLSMVPYSNRKVAIPRLYFISSEHVQVQGELGVGDTVINLNKVLRRVSIS